MNSRFFRTRRAFLSDVGRAGCAVTLATALPLHRVYGSNTLRHDGSVGARMDPGGVRALAMQAIDAAQAAGATYADVRLTRTITQSFDTKGNYGRYPSMTSLLHYQPDGPTPIEDDEQFAVGVRALVGGCWGFAASPFWTTDEMAILAIEAVRQAKENAKATPRRVELAATPAVTGSWRLQGVIDPFDVPPEEKRDALRAIAEYAARYPHPIGQGWENSSSGRCECRMMRQECALATSEGTYVTQDLYTTDLKVSVAYYQQGYMGKESIGGVVIGTYEPELRGRGWELVNAPNVHQAIDETLDAFYRRPPAPRKRPVDVGRYDVVCSAEVTAQLVSALFGNATQLDRAFGYEANAGGSSYLDAPLEMLGTFTLGTPLLTVTGERSQPGGLATVQWDDEGVVPQDFTLVSEGVLTGFQTTRESASWLRARNIPSPKPVSSYGCAASGSALDITLGHTPNLTLQPGHEEVDFETLVKDTRKGLAFIRGRTHTDFQGQTGVCGSGDGEVREIVNGKLGDVIQNAGLSFKSTELWKRLVGIGGSASLASVAATSSKGEPEQTTRYTVSAVPIKLSEQSIINRLRRA